MVNGGDVKELMNGGTSVVPNLDSIAWYHDNSGSGPDQVNTLGKQRVAEARYEEGDAH